ncbi:MAG: T9SS type A sorting domain-containing protein [Hyphomicrobiales bacterium]
MIKNLTFTLALLFISIVGFSQLDLNYKEKYQEALDFYPIGMRYVLTTQEEMMIGGPDVTQRLDSIVYVSKNEETDFYERSYTFEYSEPNKLTKSDIYQRDHNKDSERVHLYSEIRSYAGDRILTVIRSKKNSRISYTFSYYQDGSIKELVVKRSSTPWDKFDTKEIEYYDKEGNLAKKEKYTLENKGFVISSRREYAYNDKQHLTRDVSYVYDKYSNIWKKTDSVVIRKIKDNTWEYMVVNNGAEKKSGYKTIEYPKEDSIVMRYFEYRGSDKTYKVNNKVCIYKKFKDGIWRKVKRNIINSEHNNKEISWKFDGYKIQEYIEYGLFEEGLISAYNNNLNLKELYFGYPPSYSNDLNGRIIDSIKYNLDERSIATWLPWSRDESRYYNNNIIMNESLYDVRDNDRVLYAEGTYYYTKLKSKKEEEEGLFRVYPNPSTKEIYIEEGTHTEDIKVEIYDIKGAKVFSKVISGNSPILLSEFEKGIYILKASYSGKTITKKLLLE